MLTLKNITKKYNELTAVANLSFEVKKGEVLGLLGPNGAGKSTTMKIITGFLVPDSGDVLIDGQSIIENPVSLKSKIGYMPENNPLYKDMTVEESLNFTMNLHSVPKDKRMDRIDFVVEAVGISKVFFRPINELSKGFKQRVGLAQVLIHDPEILVLDEPTEGLDPNQRSEIRALIKSLGQNKTVIISTHVMQEVEALCSRIILINKGEMVIDGSKSDLQHRKIDTAEIRVRVKGENVFEKLSEKKIEIVEEKAQEGIYSFTVKTQNPNKFFADLSELIGGNKWVILELTTIEQNLEDLFRLLTK